MLGVLVIEPASPSFLPWQCVSYPLEYAQSTLGYASDFKNSKKSVSPYVSGFRFLFPPYGPLFGLSVLLQYLQHLFSPFRSYCTPWQPSNSYLHQQAVIVSAITIYKSLHRLLSSSTHIIRAYQVLVKCFFISNICFVLYMNGCSYVYWWWTCVLPSVSIRLVPLSTSQTRLVPLSPFCIGHYNYCIVSNRNDEQTHRHTEIYYNYYITLQCVYIISHFEKV